MLEEAHGLLCAEPAAATHRSRLSHAAAQASRTREGFLSVSRPYQLEFVTGGCAVPSSELPGSSLSACRFLRSQSATDVRQHEYRPQAPLVDVRAIFLN